MATASAEADTESLLEHAQREGAIQEETASRPLRAVSAENVHRGDHIIYQITEEPYRAYYESALVSCVGADQIELLKNTRANSEGHIGGVTQEWVQFSSLNHPHIIQYSPGLYSNDEAIKRAEKRLEWKEKCYHVLYNNSHHFVTLAKTGKENPLAVITKDFLYEGNSYSLDPVLTKVPTKSLDDVHPGDHLMVSSEHRLVESVSCSNKTYTAYTYSGGKVTRKEQTWKPDTFRVDYGGGADIQPAKTAIKNAIEEYLPKWAHSDEFVTMMKTGQKHSVDWQCSLVEGTQPAAIPLTPFTKSKIHSLEDIHPGDHIVITPRMRQAKHLLIVDTFKKGNTYVAFTTNGSGKIERVNEKWCSKGWFRISYHGHVHSTLVSPEEAIDKAEKESHKWVSSDGFVTMMKTGKCYSLAQQCLFSPDNNIVGYTPVTPDTAVDEGDHIILQDALNMYHSVFLYKNVTDSIFAIMPSVSDQGSLYGEVDLAGYQAYRVNYKESLPPEQAQIRACSKKGEKLLTENLHDPSVFISWAKTGKQISVSPGDVGIVATQEKGLPRKPQQIAQLRPWWYEKIISTDDIQVGDHLIRSHMTHWFHCMVTERDINPVDHTEFKIIYQFRTAVEEKEASLDPSKEKLYRIKYPETLPAVTAIEKARSKLGERSFSPTIRMQFVRWAKTGSEEGIEVDFLKNETLPVSKSRIWSFGQLDQGDYLVKSSKSWFPERTHHYLVTEVHSPTTCLALESWSPSGMVGRVIETTVFFEMSHEFYRINYNCGTCFTNEEAIQKAKSFKGHSTAENVWSDINRQKFVNFVKTGESEAIDESKLQDDRLLLPRRKVESALELKPGDHIERPVNSAVLEKLCNHHMIVTKVVNKRRCEVIHFGLSSGKKADVLQEEVDIFVKECSFCIHYSERINPEESIAILRHLIRSEQPYRFHKNNCEHLVMKATTGHPISIQVDAIVQNALQFTYKSVLKPIRTALSRATLRGGAKGVTKLAVHGTTILAYAGKAAGQAAAKAGTKAGFKAGAKVGAKAAFKLGYRAAISGTAVGAVGGIAVGVNVLFEGPLLARGLYKLRQKKKFDVISDGEYNRGIIQQSFITTNTILGGVGGAVAGQVAIPVPVVGAAVGGMLGSVVGHAAGAGEGWLASKLVHNDETPTLPVIIKLIYTECKREEYEIIQ